MSTTQRERAPAAVAPRIDPAHAWPRRFRRALTGHSLALIAGLLGSFPLPAHANDDDRLFAVNINGHSTELQAEFIERGHHLYATLDDLHALGLRTDGLHPGADGRVELGEVPGLTYNVDERNQVLDLTLTDRRLAAHQIALDRGIRSAPLTTPDLGAVLNYQFDGTEVYGRAETETALDGHLSTPWGVGASSWLLATGLPVRTLTRLDTNYTVEHPAALQRWEVGDVISGGLGWTRPYRLGGVQVASDFGVRPGLVTYPTPNLAGHADVASTVDVLVDNVRQASQPTQQGPFEITQAPVVTGANSVDLVVRDAAGHQSVQSLDFYLSPALLAPGLATYSAEAGFLRPNYGLFRDNYTAPALSATGRYGLDRRLTLEAHVEGTRQVVMGGAGLAANLFNMAAGSISFAASTPDGGPGAANTRGAPGGQVSVGVERSGRWIDLSLSATVASPAFRDVPSNAVDLPPTFQAQAGLGVSLRRFGALHFTLVAVNSRAGFTDQTADGPVTIASNRATIGTASYTHRLFGRAQLAVNCFHDFDAGRTSGVTFGISLPFGARRAAAATAGFNGGQPYSQLEASQAAYAPGQVGWRGELGENPNSNDEGQVSTVTRVATFAADVDHTNSATGYRAEVSGALVGTGHSVFFTNRVTDSYAVISSNGVPNVGVLEENRLVGHTNADGLLFLPTVTGWQDNRISLDPGDLPADVTGEKLETILRLPAASGGHVRFDLHRGTSALISLVLPNGQPVPVGAFATLGTDKPLPVGHDGAVFITTLAADNLLHVHLPHGGACTARFPYRPVANNLPELGPFTCKPDNPP